MFFTQREIAPRKVFLVLISPSKAIKNEVAGFKKEFLEKFGKAEALFSQAHTTLSNFSMIDVPEDTLEKEMRKFLKDWKSFEVQISGFEIFSNSNVLFLKPEKENIIALQRHMVTILRKLVKISTRDTPLMTYPHITIAKNISKVQLKKSWNHFKNLPYCKSFKVNKITVLRKPYPSKKKSYELAFEINLS